MHLSQCWQKGQITALILHTQAEMFNREFALSGSALVPPSFSADIPASTLGRLQGHANGFRLLQQLQHHSLQDRLRNPIPGGELQLQNGPHAG